MSNFNNTDFDNTDFNTKPTGAMRPEHHLHDSSEPLPGTGAASARPTADYSTGESIDQNVGRSRFGGQGQDQLGEYGSGLPETTPARHDRPTQVTFDDERQHDTTARDTGASGIGREEAYTDRPLGVQPAKQGGVALGGREKEELPMGKAGFGDKMIGKTQKVMGKMSNNPEMHEKGELREAGGKPAVTGSARAPHD
ncbi:hypothetical protein D9756_009887 [Leucocoprinus leucothites]|uniref:Uncharacterized protein n=1 Tax=Leucocoprinus leucothites TaxID=201217 RepID=A0A8H5CSP5_9AGAR|nr:hypothetical protein D9756_009887 [Leucoagaricus leucothites]